LYRLTAIQNGSGTSLESFSYGPTGDRLSETVQGQSAQSYTYSLGTHHLASVGGNARTYDPNGNTQTLAGQPATYDDRNRLLGLQLTNGTIALGTPGTLYNYNGRGERVLKEIAAGSVGSGSGALQAKNQSAGIIAPPPSNWSETPTVYVYNENGQTIGEYVVTVSGGAVSVTSTSEYVYLDSIPVGFVTGSGTQRQVYYVETDHLGTPRQVIKPGVTPATDSMVWKWDYFANNAAFGENSPIARTLTFNLRFPGQYNDSETGLNYNSHRDYEAGTGRYVESDPIGLRGGPSSYSYSFNSPLTLIDTYGLAYGFPDCTKDEVPRWIWPEKASERLIKICVPKPPAPPAPCSEADCELKCDLAANQCARQWSDTANAGSFAAGAALILIPEPTMTTKVCAVGILATSFAAAHNASLCADQGLQCKIDCKTCKR
jgi:RHS repeat-associated protein